MRSVASAADLLNTEASTSMTNSMVVKSSLCRMTRQSRGLSVRVRFSVTTSTSPSGVARGFPFAIPDGSYRTLRACQGPRLAVASKRTVARFPPPLPSARSRRFGGEVGIRREDQGGAAADREGRRAEVPPEERRDGQAVRARAGPPAARRGELPRGRRPRKPPRSGASRRWRDHRAREDRRPPRRPDGERLDRQSGFLGPPDRREDPSYPGAGPEAALPDDLPRRFGGSADHRSARHVPRPARRGADLLPPVPDERPRPPTLPALRSQRRRRRVHPRLLRHRRDGRGKRIHVPRLAADGRDGDRREGDSGRAGRGADALLDLGLRRPAGEDRRRGDPDREAVPELPA